MCVTSCARLDVCVTSCARLDEYGAEDEAEFFAVATEDFYERPTGLKTAHPRLYGLLQEFYAVDPAAW